MNDQSAKADYFVIKALEDGVHVIGDAWKQYKIPSF